MKQNYNAWGVKIEDFPESGSLSEQLTFMLGFAVLAPSGHNSQPWNFSVTENKIDIIVDNGRALAKSDPTQRILLIGFGCCLKNILIAADYYGFSTSYEILWEQTSQRIRVTLERTSGIKKDDSSHLIRMIAKRHSNRGVYTNDKLPEEFKKKLQEINTVNASVNMIPESESRFIADLILKTLISSMESTVFREELSHYIKSSYTKENVGMPGFTLGLPGVFSLFASYLIKKINISKKTHSQDKKLLYTHTPALLVIDTQNDDRMDHILAGMLLEEVWLIATSFGLSCSIYASITQDIVARNELRKSSLGFKNPQISLRVGFAKKEMGKSPRFTVNALLNK